MAKSALSYVSSDLQFVSDSDALGRAWTRTELFILLPQARGIDESWIRSVSDLVPSKYRDGHFGLFTSGSTGRPKLLIAARKRAESLCRVLHEVQLAEPVKETVVALPLTYSFAFVNQWVWAKTMGRDIRLTDGFSEPPKLRAALANARNASLCLVGSQVQLLEHFFKGTSFDGVIRLHFAGGSFPQDQLGLLRDFFPNAKIFNNYGCAEAMPRLTIQAAEQSTESSNIGWALPGVKLSTREDHSIVFLSPYRAVARVDEQGFAEIEDHEWIPTGDLGQSNPDGSWKLLGRSSEVFKRHGEKISLVTVMANLRAVASGTLGFYLEKDRASEQGWVLVVSPHPSEEKVEEILGVLRANFSRSHWPLRVESVEAIPMLFNGKLDARALASLPDKRNLWSQRI
jgi:acyl-coenzyme A synthetase/AMP-(fatty) acid ligase